MFSKKPVNFNLAFSCKQMQQVNWLIVMQINIDTVFLVFNVYLNENLKNQRVPYGHPFLNNKFERHKKIKLNCQM